MMPILARTIPAGIRGLFLAGLLLVPLNIDASENERPQLKSREHVILLHGMARTKDSMSKLEEYLSLNNYTVINSGYPSTSEPVEKIADDYLATMIEQCIKTRLKRYTLSPILWAGSLRGSIFRIICCQPAVELS